MNDQKATRVVFMKSFGSLNPPAVIACITKYYRKLQIVAHQFRSFHKGRNATQIISWMDATGSLRLRESLYEGYINAGKR